jgi:hypothetical protein
VTDSVVATPQGFASLKRINSGGPAQNRRVPLRWHQERLDPGDETLLLAPAVIAKELSKFRCDPKFRGDRRVPLRALARYARVGKNVLYAACKGRRISNQARLRLSLALRDIMAGKVRFKRCGGGVRFEPLCSD